MEPLRKRIEASAIAKLAPLRNAYLKTIEPYAAEFSSGNIDEVKEALRGRVPGILVATGASVPSRLISASLAVEKLTLEVYLISASMRSMVDRQQGDGGIYQMIEEQRPLLMGKSLGIKGVGVPVSAGTRPLIRLKTLNAWVVEYELDVTVTGAPEKDLGFRDIELNHKLVTKDDPFEQTGVLVESLVETEN